MVQQGNRFMEVGGVLVVQLVRILRARLNLALNQLRPARRDIRSILAEDPNSPQVTNCLLHSSSQYCYCLGTTARPVRTAAVLRQAPFCAKPDNSSSTCTFATVQHMLLRFAICLRLVGLRVNDDITRLQQRRGIEIWTLTSRA